MEKNGHVPFETFFLTDRRYEVWIYHSIARFPLKTETEQFPKRRNINIKNHSPGSRDSTNIPTEAGMFRMYKLFHQHNYIGFGKFYGIVYLFYVLTTLYVNVRGTAQQDF